MKIILIRGPLTDEEVISSFPLVHYVKKEYENSKIIIILNDGQKNLYHFLPFNVDVHFIPKDKMTMMGIHHFAVNLLEVFNVDYFIDLENNLKSSFLGFSFKAKNRLGYKYGLNSLFLTYKMDGKKIVIDQEADEKYLNLFLNYKKVNTNDFKVRPFYEEKLKSPEERGILIILSNFNNYKNELVRLYSEFEEQKFLLSAVNNDERLKESEFLKAIKSEETSNHLQIMDFETYPELLKNIFHSSFVITDIDWVSYCSAYSGRDSFLLSREIKTMPKCKYFDSSPIRVTFNDNSIVMNMERENQKISDIKGLAEFIHNFLNL